MIFKTKSYSDNDNLVLLINDIGQIDKSILNKDEQAYVCERIEQKKYVIELNRFTKWIYVFYIVKEADNSKNLEACRKGGNEIQLAVNDKKLKEVSILDFLGNGEITLAFAEGMALGNYQFLKYFKEKDKKQNSLNRISIYSESVNETACNQLNIVVSANTRARTFVNEPVNYLNAEKLAEEVAALFEGTNAKVEVLNKKEIESLKMGGLLAVNMGSIDPPTFTIIEWKPENSINSKPYVFVGKGIVYDTGGLNIKTADYMNDMKCDMAGGAAVAGAMCAIVKAGLAVHVIGLIPATDNRPLGNAYVSGDVIRMYDGTQVEVINTDAEGRMILADALAYAKKYDPELVIDLATLTGSAERAIGPYGIVGMGTKSDDEMALLQKSGELVYERVVKFPFWDEYAEELKSPIADIKHLGGANGGAITAGKFLEHFTDYPYIHLDIAGPAFLNKKDSYRGEGGSAVGVRLLFDFIKQKVN